MAATFPIRLHAPDAARAARAPVARADPAARASEVHDPSITSAAPPSIRRLLANEQYFGLAAREFRAGSERLLARMSKPREKRARVDVHTIGEDFALDPDASWTLLRALVAARLLQPLASGAYRPNARFAEYARASIVEPLSRTRARALVRKACAVVETINAEWRSSPFRIETVAVTGAYMSRRKQLPELSLWLIVRLRRDDRVLRTQDKSAALRRILQEITALSSFIVVRMTPRRSMLPRPFSVVYQAEEPTTLPTWRRLTLWSAALGRRLR